MSLLIVKVNLPQWTPLRDYLGKKLDKPYWIFAYVFPDGSGFIQNINGMN